MAKLGRISTYVGIAGTAILFLVVGLLPTTGPGATAAGWLLPLAGLTTVAAFCSWILAMVHSRREARSDRVSRRWILAATVGVFLGAWAYWIAMPHQHPRIPT